MNQNDSCMLTKKNMPLLLLLTFLIGVKLHAQHIEEREVERIIQTLASDEMRGRSAGTADAVRAAEFIAKEFEKIGLEHYGGLSSYLQPFQKAGKTYQNVVGVLPGKSKKNEYILFSGHYDHIGILSAVEGDSIANGADDDASGVTAVMSLAKYFKAKNIHERTLVFVAFTAEEIGGFGSKYFATTIKPRQYVAGVNIEMVGKISKFGRNAAFITGFERSDFGKILQKNVQDKGFSFHPDPYPSQGLFYRSDNAKFALMGIPAHTISSVQIDKDVYYHSVDDEVSTLDIKNLTQMIRAIALGTRTLASGEDTPTRLKGK